MTEASVDLVADDATLPSAAPPDRRGQRLLSRIGWLLVVVWAAVTVTYAYSRVVLTRARVDDSRSATVDS